MASNRSKEMVKNFDIFLIYILWKVQCSSETGVIYN